MKRDKPPPRLLLESIRIQDGIPDLLPYHQERMDRSRRALYPKSPVLKLKKILEQIDLPGAGCFKLRLQYEAKLVAHELVPYAPTPVSSVRIIDADDLRYGRKYADRQAIKTHFARRGDCDEILMIQRGHVTDTSYANVALYDGSHWYTPAWPLLRGTRREKLIQEGTLRAYMIRERDLGNFEKMRLVNAMLPWGTGPEVGMKEVRRIG